MRDGTLITFTTASRRPATTETKYSVNESPLTRRHDNRPVVASRSFDGPSPILVFDSTHDPLIMLSRSNRLSESISFLPVPRLFYSLSITAGIKTEPVLPKLRGSFQLIRITDVPL